MHHALCSTHYLLELARRHGAVIAPPPYDALHFTRVGLKAFARALNEAASEDYLWRCLHMVNARATVVPDSIVMTRSQLRRFVERVSPPPEGDADARHTV